MMDEMVHVFRLGQRGLWGSRWGEALTLFEARHVVEVASSQDIQWAVGGSVTPPRCTPLQADSL